MDKTGKADAKKFASPLSKARGLGSAHEGVHHWLHQRITAIANLPLVLWAVYSMVHMRGASYGEFIAWMQLPWNTVLMILLILSVSYHAVLGLQVVIEDYVSCKALKMMKIIGVKLLFTALSVICIVSILKVAL